MTFIADYSRQLSLDWMSESKQASIIQSRVLIFGAGGLGVAAVGYLAGAGVGTITVVDSDRIEASNLHRQTIYRVADIGDYKAKVAASYIAERNPNSVVDAITSVLDLPELYQLCERHDVILDCTDDQPFSFLLNTLCMVCNKKAVFANAVKLEGQLFVLELGADNPCFKCLWTNDQPQVPTCNQQGVLGPVPGVLGCIQALETIKILVNQPSDLSCHLLHCDFVTYEFSKLKVLKQDSCCHQLVYADLEREYDAYISKTIPKIEELDLSSYMLIDIRSQDELFIQPCKFDAQHIELQLLAANSEDFINQESDYLILCSSGKRSKILSDDLNRKGYKTLPCRLY